MYYLCDYSIRTNRFANLYSPAIQLACVGGGYNIQDSSPTYLIVMVGVKPGTVNCKSSIPSGTPSHWAAADPQLQEIHL